MHIFLFSQDHLQHLQFLRSLGKNVVIPISTFDLQPVLFVSRPKVASLPQVRLRQLRRWMHLSHLSAPKLITLGESTMFVLFVFKNEHHRQRLSVLCISFLMWEDGQMCA